MVVAAFTEIFQVSFLFTYLEDGLWWLGCTFAPDFAVSEEKLLLGHVLFALVGLNKDCLGHADSLDKLCPRTSLGPSQPIILGRSPQYIYILNVINVEIIKLMEIYTVF